MCSKQNKPKTRKQSLLELQALLPGIEQEIRSKVIAQKQEYDRLGLCYRESVDPGDKSSVRTLQGVINGRISLLNGELERVNAIREVIKDDCYGYCDCCGIDISLDRMKEQPLTSKCSDCKKLLEFKNHNHTSAYKHQSQLIY